MGPMRMLLFIETISMKSGGDQRKVKKKKKDGGAIILGIKKCGGRSAIKGHKKT